MTDAIKKSLIVAVAALASMAAVIAAEQWFYFPRSLAWATGCFVMFVIVRPLVAPDLPAHRWIVIPLSGAAITLVLLTAPRWYAEWTAPDRPLPDFLPTEQDFIGQTIYYAEGSRGEQSPMDCGTYHAGDDTSAGKECAEAALAAGAAFYLFFYPAMNDTFGALALSHDGFNDPYVFRYSLDGGGRHPRASLAETWCPEARFLPGPGIEIQCGPRPTLAEFREEVRIGKECGHHSVIHDVRYTHVNGLDCARAALAAREAFHYRFQTDFGGDTGIVDGALSWDPATESAPLLSYFFGTGALDDFDHTLIQRFCPTPRLRLVRPQTGDLNQDGRDTSVEVDCGLNLEGSQPSR